MSNRRKSARPAAPTAKQRPAPAAPVPAAAKPMRTLGGLSLSKLRAIILFIFGAGVIVYVISQGTGMAAPADDSAEAGFARDMKTHHAQAVEMAMIVRDRTTDNDLRSFLTDMILTQQNQVGQFEGWLGVWELPLGTAAKPMAWMGHEVDGLMPGMATQAEIDALRTLPHDEMVREFIRLMIAHHQSGVEMAQGVIDRSENEVVVRLAESIVATQSAEIELLNGILARYGGGSATPGATPVVGTPEATPHSH